MFETIILLWKSLHRLSMRPNPSISRVVDHVMDRSKIQCVSNIYIECIVLIYLSGKNT